jgi:hypothetical protein
MSKFKKIINSFQLKDSLNPKIWENPEDPKNAVLKSKVQNALLKIADEFIDTLDDDVFVEDVILTGSLANFNWSEFSDFDLHILIDFSQYGDSAELYKELFDLKKYVFNEKHNITIYSYDVEVYAQDTEESHFASGVWSLMNKEWITVPEKQEFKLDKKVLANKIKCWTDKIDRTIETSEVSDDKELLTKVKEKLKEYRKSGLEKDGELSYENLVFKFLRRSGHIQKLFDMNNKVMDKELSLEVKVNESRQVKKFLVENEELFDVIINSFSPKVEETNSPFLKGFEEIYDNNLRFEFTPGQKIPFETEVEKIQSGLQLLNYSLPKWGVDGKFGPETEEATKNFQEDQGLTVNGVFGPQEAKKLVEKLIETGFEESDLSKVQKKADYELRYPSIKSSLNFEDNVKIITDTLEGGYYHPDMKKREPGKFAIMGDSGETMFGIDRKHGASFELDTQEGKEFWRLIDAENAKDNWKYGYELEDRPELRDKLISLIAVNMEKGFYDLSERYLSEEAQQIVMTDPKLFFHFLYATYNGSGWFQGFAKKFNNKIEEGVKDVEELRDFVIQTRKNSGNKLISRSGDKIEKIFDAMP